MSIVFTAFVLTDDRLTLLSEREREALRLVHRGYESKEIAPLLRISPDRVNKLVKGAMRKLGVSRRVVAARMLFEFEGAAAAQQVPHPLGAPTLGVAPFPPTASDGATIPSEHDRRRAPGTDTGSESPRHGRTFKKVFEVILSLWRAGGQRNDLTSRPTIVAIAVIACAAAVTAGAATALLLLLNWLITSR